MAKRKGRHQTEVTMWTRSPQVVGGGVKQHPFWKTDALTLQPPYDPANVVPHVRPQDMRTYIHGKTYM